MWRHRKALSAHPSTTIEYSYLQIGSQSRVGGRTSSLEPLKHNLEAGRAGPDGGGRRRQLPHGSQSIWRHRRHPGTRAPAKRASANGRGARAAQAPPPARARVTARGQRGALCSAVPQTRGVSVQWTSGTPMSSPITRRNRSGWKSLHNISP